MATNFFDRPLSVSFVDPNTGWAVGDNGTILHTTDGGLVPITTQETQPEIPTGFTLRQNFPNPFNPTTTIEYVLPRSSLVTLEVYNLLGQKVRTLVNNQQSAGNYTVEWDGRNDAGIKVTSGVYLYRPNAYGFTETKKMILLK